MNGAAVSVEVPVVKLPPYPTKAEIVDALNAAFPSRRDKFTERVVRGWQERRYIRPHPAFRNPTRFDSKQVAAFLEAKMGCVR